MTSPNPTLAAIVRLDDLRAVLRSERFSRSTWSETALAADRQQLDTWATDIDCLIAALEEKTREVEEVRAKSESWHVRKAKADAKAQWTRAALALAALSTSRERERDLEKALENAVNSLNFMLTLNIPGLSGGARQLLEAGYQDARQALALRPTSVSDADTGHPPHDNGGSNAATRTGPA
jgi:hypothetical protein